MYMYMIVVMILGNAYISRPRYPCFSLFPSAITEYSRLVIYKQQKFICLTGKSKTMTWVMMLFSLGGIRIGK
jgi:hypothetical protein